MHGLRCFVIATVVAGAPASVWAQVGVPLSAPLPAVVQQAPMPATRLESFQAEAGLIVTLGHEELGPVARNRISVDVRDLRDAKGNSAGGLTVFLTDSLNLTPARHERAFVDVDELQSLLRNLDTLLKYTANPTTLKRFEARFSTRGGLTFIAYSNSSGAIEYAVQAGRPLLATVTNIDAVEILKLRGLFELGLQKLNAAGYASAAQER